MFFDITDYKLKMKLLKLENDEDDKSKWKSFGISQTFKPIFFISYVNEELNNISNLNYKDLTNAPLIFTNFTQN